MTRNAMGNTASVELSRTVDSSEKSLPYVLTHSALSAYRSCPRKFELAYIHQYRAKKTAHPLFFGTAVHRAIEAFWRAYMAGAKDPAAIAIAVIEQELKGFDLAKARPMMVAYCAVWMAHKWKVLAVEAKFRIPMKHPSGRTSDRFVLEGKIDLVLLGPDGVVRIVDHKTSGVDVGEGSIYRRKLNRDEQFTLYLDGAASLGHVTDRLTCDILRKPKLKPKLATPVDKRRYTTDAKTKERRLYAKHREHDETAEEFEARVSAQIAAAPDQWIIRVRVDRNDGQRKRFSLNIWNQSNHLASDLDGGHFSENTGACEMFGRDCAFAPHCLSNVPLSDPYVFEKKSSAHEELEEETDDLEDETDESNDE